LALPDVTDFSAELSRFATEQADGRVTAIAERAAAPLRLAVRGRRGVGRGTVARALDRAASAIEVAPPESAVEVVVYVTAEVIKPEDADAIAAAGRPVVVVLNKADLAGSLSGRNGDGPIEAARARSANLSKLVGVPVEPMIGLLAVAALDGLDERSWAALRVLAAHPSAPVSLDGSFAGFLAADNPVPSEVRLHLLATLDLFGIALGIAALRKGVTSAQVRRLLRRASCLDAVLRTVSAGGAEARYRRVLDAVAELEALAVGRTGLGDQIGGFLCSDATVVARMAAAAEFARYSRDPASDLHRACAADIARGSVRLWSRELTPRAADVAR